MFIENRTNVVLVIQSVRQKIVITLVAYPLKYYLLFTVN